MNKQSLIRTILIYNAYNSGMSVPTIKERFQCTTDEVYLSIVTHNEHIEKGIPESIKTLLRGIIQSGSLPTERIALFYGLTEERLEHIVFDVKRAVVSPKPREKTDNEQKTAFLEDYASYSHPLTRGQMAVKYGLTVAQIDHLLCNDTIPRGVSERKAKEICKDYWSQKKNQANLKELATKHGISYDKARKWAAEYNACLEEVRSIG